MPPLEDILDGMSIVDSAYDSDEDHAVADVVASGGGSGTAEANSTKERKDGPTSEERIPDKTGDKEDPSVGICIHIGKFQKVKGQADHVSSYTAGREDGGIRKHLDFHPWKTQESVPRRWELLMWLVLCFIEADNLGLFKQGRKLRPKTTSTCSSSVPTAAASLPTTPPE